MPSVSQKRHYDKEHRQFTLIRRVVNVRSCAFLPRAFFPLNVLMSLRTRYDWWSQLLHKQCHFIPNIQGYFDKDKASPDQTLLVNDENDEKTANCNWLTFPPYKYVAQEDDLSQMACLSLPNWTFLLKLNKSSELNESTKSHKSKGIQGLLLLHHLVSVNTQLRHEGQGVLKENHKDIIQPI